ncbi:hypothetical protein [Bacillus sp. m3-13]|nr:hypothetical protein [Bacillus sp. m3-13]
MTEKYQSREQRRQAMQEERSAKSGKKKKGPKKGPIQKNNSYLHLLSVL